MFKQLILLGRFTRHTTMYKTLIDLYDTYLQIHLFIEKCYTKYSARLL